MVMALSPRQREAEIRVSGHCQASVGHGRAIPASSIYGAGLSLNRRSRLSRTHIPSPVLEEQRGDQRRPAGLVAGAKAGAVVAVEILVKGNVISPVRVALEVVAIAPDGTPPAPGGVAQED